MFTANCNSLYLYQYLYNVCVDMHAPDLSLIELFPVLTYKFNLPEQHMTALQIMSLTVRIVQLLTLSVCLYNPLIPFSLHLEAKEVYHKQTNNTAS